MNLVQKMFGTHSQRELKRIMPLVDKIESLRPTMQALTDEQLRDKTTEYKKRYAEGESPGFPSAGSIRHSPGGG